MKRILFLIFSTLFSVQAISAVIYVNINATGGNSGANWIDAFNDLQDAIALSTFGDEIWVAQGTYKPTSGTSRTVYFNIKNGTQVYGGFVGGETLLSQRDVEQNVTVLSGEIATGSASDNTYHVVYFSNVGNQTRLDGFTVTGGYCNVSSSAYGGGAIVSASSPTLANCKFQGNYAADGGGALNHSTSGVLTIENCVFDGNVGNTYGGGALRLYSATVNISDSYFKSNQSDTYGGAIFIYNSIVTISRSVFAGNISQTSGSAVRVSDVGTLHMDNCLVVGNYTNTTGTITSSTFSNSSAHTIINCTIAQNKQDNSGGSSTNSAVALNAQASVVNSIIYGNMSTNQVLSTGLTFNNSLTQMSTNNATGTNILYTDPQFVLAGNVTSAPFDTTGLNYHLDILSEAIDVGSNSSATSPNDLAGNARIYNNTVDLGSYEEDYCVSTSQFTTPSPYAICGGTPITLEVTGGVNHLWSTGSTANTISVSTAGTYSVIFEDQGGCRGQLSANVTSSANPTPVITFGGGNLSTGTFSVYQWYFNGNIINGANGSTHVPIQGYGLYEVIVQNAAGCEGISEYCLSPATLSADGPTTFCEGGDVNLTVANGDNYVWSTGSLNSQINVSTSGLYSVTVFSASAGCSVVLEETVTVNPNPNPTVTFNGQDFTTGAFTTYQWNFNSNPITGATSQSYDPIATGNGQYSVTVTNSFGCETTSSIYNLSDLGLDELVTSSIKCYPNPSNGIVNIVSTKEMKNITISNSLGQVIADYQLNGVFDFSFELQTKVGVYFVRVNTNSGEETIYLIRE